MVQELSFTLPHSHHYWGLHHGLHAELNSTLYQPRSGDVIDLVVVLTIHLTVLF